MRQALVILSVLLLFIVIACKSDTDTPISPEEAKIAMDTGQKITTDAFRTLSSELKHALQTGGLPKAINYCNLNALGITDSISTKYNASIKRTSLNFRNVRNKPTEVEKEILTAFQTSYDNQKGLTPVVKKSEKEMHYYAPILVSQACLKCHGKQENIDQYDLIKNKYPNDLATGYIAGDLRGMWHVTFKQNQIN